MELRVGYARGRYGGFVACYAIAGTFFVVGFLGWLMCMRLVYVSRNFYSNCVVKVVVVMCRNGTGSKCI